MDKPKSFDPSVKYQNLKAASKANKEWYKQTCAYYRSQYKQALTQADLTNEQRARLFTIYQNNLTDTKQEYERNKKALKFANTPIKVKKTTNKQGNTIEDASSTGGYYWKKFTQIFTNKKVLAGIFFTLFVLLVFHIGSIISIPGISIPKSYETSDDFSSLLNLLAGGGLTRMSVFAVGVGPYITSQIIIQLLSSDLIPPLSRMQKQGERGKRKLEVITRIVTLPFCLVQAYAVIALILNMNNSGSTTDTFSIFGKTSIGDLSAGQIIALMVILTGGSYLAIFFGDMITKRGVGNGITVIILAGILSSLFGNFAAVYNSIASKVSPTLAGYQLTVILLFVVYMIFYFLILLVVVFINNCIRKIPIQQTGQGLTSDVNNLPYLPIKLNSAGVIPVIFASSIISIPTTIAQFLSEGSGKWIIQDYFTLSSWTGMILYFVLIVLFTFFYSYVQINPPQMAENFEKSGKFIPGVQSGVDTEKHISRVLSRVNWMGSFFLAIIAVLPYIVSKLTGIASGIAVGGTGIIIIVSASLEIWNSIKSAMTVTGYDITRNKIQSNYYNDESDNNEKVEELW